MKTNKNWYSTVMFNEPDLFEHDKDYYMSMTEEEAISSKLDWVDNYHIDEGDYIEEDLLDGTEYMKSVINFLTNSISDTGDCSLPVLVTCIVIPLNHKTEEEEHELWNVLVKTPQDCVSLADGIKTGKRSLWPN